MYSNSILPFHSLIKQTRDHNTHSLEFGIVTLWKRRTYYNLSNEFQNAKMKSNKRMLKIIFQKTKWEEENSYSKKFRKHDKERRIVQRKKIALNSTKVKNNTKDSQISTYSKTFWCLNFNLILVTRTIHEI